MPSDLPLIYFMQSLLAKSIRLSYSKSKDKVTVEEVMKSNSHSIQNNENDD